MTIAGLTFPASGALADSPICHNGILSDDAGMGCTNDGPYGGPPVAHTSSTWSDGPICHDGSLADDAGQNCADGLYERVYGSYSNSTPTRTYPSYSSSSPSGVYSSGDYSNVPGVPTSFAACVAYRESSNGAGSSNIYGIIPASGVDVSGMSVSQQKAAFAQMYAEHGTSAWAPYDGC
jgi:hypothetical protein